MYKPKAILNSPRSIDACRRQGIEVNELLYLSLENYKQKSGKKDLERSLLQKRWEHFEEKRKEKLKLVIEERNKIIEEEKQGMWKPMKSIIQQSLQRSKGSVMRRSQYKESTIVVTDSAMLDKERKQLEKIKLKQQQELQQMMEYELKS